MSWWQIMNEMAPQYSPAQILDAARRAESDGRTDHAVQFYRHLAMQFASTPVGAIATESLNRLGAPLVGNEDAPPDGPMNEMGFGEADNYSSAISRASNGYAHGGGGPDVDRSKMQYSAPPYSPQQGARGARLAPFPEPNKGYLLGRCVAFMVIVAGALAFFSGIVIAGAALFKVAIVTDLLKVVPLLISVEAGLVMLAAGIGAVLIGQVALAIFNSANSARDAADLAAYQVEIQLGQSADGVYS